jgi:hypothetical protein
VSQEYQREAFERIKKYLMSPPVVQALKAGKGFMLYIAMQEHVICACIFNPEVVGRWNEVRTHWKSFVCHYIMHVQNEDITC